MRMLAPDLLMGRVIGECQRCVLVEYVHIFKCSTVPYVTIFSNCSSIYGVLTYFNLGKGGRNLKEIKVKTGTKIDATR